MCLRASAKAVLAKYSLRVPFIIGPQVVKWLIIAGLVGILSGSASALFLFSLEWATRVRESHPWLIVLLPLGGLGVGLLYHRLGESVEGGTNLIIDQIHEPKSTIPLRMAPFVFVGTVVTHFFGGSAGREGTALQMGASLADQLCKPFKMDGEDRRTLLMAGISAGFASVFGTPLAGAIFGLEVLAIGRIKYSAIFPCFMAAIIGDQITLAWGIRHTSYTITAIPVFSALRLLSAIFAGACFGIVGMLFSKMTHETNLLFKRYILYAPYRPFIGGCIVAGLVGILGTTKYIGLGIPTISESFYGQLPPWDFAGKFLFTVITLGAGFKGGEVTPLFYVGATLGNALSCLLPLPLSLLTGMGFVAVFAGAANTPLSSTLMAIELFGDKAGVFTAIACIASYLFSGHAGIYHAQKIVHYKYRKYLLPGPLPLAAISSALKKERNTTDE